MAASDPLPIPDAGALEIAAEVRVVYADVDRMGVVYYGNYMRYFEIGRAEYLRRRGRAYLSIEEDDGVRMPVVEAHCRYLRSATYDQLLHVATRVLDVGHVRVRFGYRVLRASDGEELATGHTVHACVDLAGKLCRLPAALRELLRAA